VALAITILLIFVPIGLFMVLRPKTAPRHDRADQRSDRRQDRQGTGLAPPGNVVPDLYCTLDGCRRQ
jgi:hypothetical protein